MQPKPTTPTQMNGKKPALSPHHWLVSEYGSITHILTLSDNEEAVDEDQKCFSLAETSAPLLSSQQGAGASISDHKAKM